MAWTSTVCLGCGRLLSRVKNDGPRDITDYVGSCQTCSREPGEPEREIPPDDGEKQDGSTPQARTAAVFAPAPRSMTVAPVNRSLRVDAAAKIATSRTATGGDWDAAQIHQSVELAG